MKRSHGFALAAVAGMVVGLLWTPPAVMVSNAEDVAWSPPALADLGRYNRADFDTAKHGLHWGGEHQDASAPAEVQQAWRLAGISREPEPVALIQINESKQLLRVTAGASLPDGTRVEHIEKGRVTVVNGDCRRTLQLYRQGQTESSSGCETAGDETN